MDTLQKAVLIGHTLIAILIIVLVLLQRGKGAEAGAAFGAGASGTVFGARGSGSFFSRATAICATLFFVTSLSLAYLSSQSGTPSSSSVLDDSSVVEETVDAALPSVEELEDAASTVDDGGDVPELDELPAEDLPSDDGQESE